MARGGSAAVDEGRALIGARGLVIAHCSPELSREGKIGCMMLAVVDPRFNRQASGGRRVVGERIGMGLGSEGDEAAATELLSPAANRRG